MSACYGVTDIVGHQNCKNKVCSKAVDITLHDFLEFFPRSTLTLDANNNG